MALHQGCTGREWTQVLCWREKGHSLYHPFYSEITAGGKSGFPPSSFIWKPE